MTLKQYKCSKCNEIPDLICKVTIYKQSANSRAELTPFFICESCLRMWLKVL